MKGQGPAVPVEQMRQAFWDAFGPPPAGTQGDPLVIVMQLEEMDKKLDSILESLKRIETCLYSDLFRERR